MLNGLSQPGAPGREFLKKIKFVQYIIRFLQIFRGAFYDWNHDLVSGTEQQQQKTTLNKQK